MILTADGRYSIVVSRPELPKIGAGNRDRGTAEENRAIASGSIAHVGRPSASMVGTGEVTWKRVR